MFTGLSRVYPLLGLLSGYVIVLLFNPVRLALRDGFRCLLRYKRVWLTFVLLGFAYFVFQFSTFTPIQSTADLDLTQITSMASWRWPTFLEIWQEAPLPALEGVAGIFDNATTTYPLSAIAAVLMLMNWRGLHGALVCALQKRFRILGYLIYFVLLLSAIAALVKPIVYWAHPIWVGLLQPPKLLQVLLAFFMNISVVLDYLPIERVLMCGLIIIFSSVQISLALHNETLREAIRAHREFIRHNLSRFGWFLLICGIHFFLLTVADAIVRGAIADRLVALILWKSIFVT